jgi:DNA-binding GntR family transcriptional regulator
MDALKMLENDGFIEIIPQSGCKVIDYSQKDVTDQLLLGRALESLCAELAVENHTEQQLESLENLQFNIGNNLTSIKNNIEYFSYNRKFHYLIASMTQSAKIRDHAIQMWDILDFYLMRIFKEDGVDIAEAYNYHNQIMVAIKNKNKSSARKLMEDHMNSYLEQIPYSLN